MSHRSGAAKQPRYVGAHTRRGRHTRRQAGPPAHAARPDRARLLARPDVIGAEVLLLVAAGVLVHEPVLDLFAPVVSEASVPAQTPRSLHGAILPLEVAPVAVPTPTRNAPRDPFSPLVPAAAPVETAAPPVDASAPVAAPQPQLSVSVPELPSAAAPAPVPAPAPAPAPGGQTIVVKHGDTLARLATAHGTTTKALHEANRAVIGTDWNRLLPGMRLRLP